MQSKLTELQKMELRSKYWKGIPVQQLCKEYEISKTTAYYWISPCRTKQSFADFNKDVLIQKGYETEIIFSTEIGTYSNKTTIRRMLNKIYKKIGVPQHTFHSFRHTYGTNLSRAGVPIERTSKLMGHSSTEVTQKYYINVGQEEMQDAACKIVQFSLEAHKKSS